MSKILTVIVPPIVFFVFARPVSAHAFGQNYTLPLPVWLYLWGGSVAIIVSFFLIAFFFRNSKPTKHKSLLTLKAPNTEIVLFFVIIARTIFIVLFATVIIAGLIASQSPTENFAPVAFWIIFYLGITYLSAIFGGFWEKVNPLYLLTSLFNFKKKLNYPPKLAYFPALVFYLFLIWLELASNGLGIKPKFISDLLIIYSLFTFLGSYIFGYKTWFKYADFFSVFFSTIAKISPIKIQNKKILLNFDLSGEAKNLSLLFFIMFALASTAFDGFRQTKTWITFFDWIDSSIYLIFKSSLQSSAIETLALLFSPFVFLYLYMLSIVAMKQVVKTQFSVVSLALKFAFTLIPIATAYNVAHYFSLLFIQGQSAIFQISDPFNLGWNLFGTANYKINVALLSASSIWNVEVATIILGHIAAVYFAHIKAQEVYVQNKKTIVSQIPMLILMIIYTMTGLWILSQPLTLKG